MSNRFEQTLQKKRRYMNYQVHGKVYIINHQRNANLNHNKVLYTPTKTVKILKIDNIKCWQGYGVNRTLIPYETVIPLLGFHPRETKHLFTEKLFYIPIGVCIV